MQVRIGKISFFVGSLSWFFRAWTLTGACVGLVGVAARGGGRGEPRQGTENDNTEKSSK